jgi:SsrA-binding protein
MSLITHKKIGLLYETKESIEAGLELRGYEAKSLSSSLGSLEGTKIIIRGGEAFVIGMYVPPYQPANTPKSYDPYRVRRLLLSKKEILKLSSQIEGTELLIVPVSIYKNRRLKMQIALVRKKNKEDKREAIRARDDKKEMRKVIFGE